MKKFLCICLALVLALSCACALAEEDLQAQLDAANAKIAELQALVDTYYPFYAAQVVATYGEDGVIWLEDMQAEYDAMAAQYASSGIDLVAYGLDSMLKQDLVNSAVESAVLLEKAEALGLCEYDEDALAAMEAEANEVFEGYVDYYCSYFYADAEEITDEMRTEAAEYWASSGMDAASILQSMKNEKAYAAIHEYVTKDVAINEDDVQAAYTQLIEDNKTNYADDRTYNSDRNSGVAIAWHPENYRAVKHVLVKFNDEQAALYTDLNSQLNSLNSEKEAAQNPSEDAEVQPRSIEEINADIAACATEMEALYTQLLPRAEEVIAKFNEGANFEDLIAEYNDDPGMTSGVTAEIGYAVSAESTAWDPAFTKGAMSIANKGEISAPVYGSYGIHIIWYMDDVVSGEVALEEIRADVETDALESKIQSTYDDQVAAWLEEMNVEYFYENFGITAA